jgi:hypothetical protein
MADISLRGQGRRQCWHQVVESAAWQRKEGKSASGGLNRKGIASYRSCKSWF